MWNRKLRRQLADAQKAIRSQEHAIINLLTKKSLLEEDLRRSQDRLRKALQGDEGDEESPNWLYQMWRRARGFLTGLSCRSAVSSM